MAAASDKQAREGRSSTTSLDLDIGSCPHTPVKYHYVAEEHPPPPTPLPFQQRRSHTQTHAHSVLGVNCDFWVTADVLEESRRGAEVSVAPELHPPLRWNLFFLCSGNKKRLFPFV